MVDKFEMKFDPSTIEHLGVKMGGDGDAAATSS